MGDIIETRAAKFRQPCFYYKLSDKCMWFEIKTQSGVTVGLTTEDGKDRNLWFENYLIRISNPGEIKIQKRNEILKTASGLPFTLSEESYNRFWVSCYDKFMWVGIGHSSQMVLSCEVNCNLEYIVFNTLDPYDTCLVKFEVPPLYDKIPRAIDNPMVTKGKLQWKNCNNQLPDDCVIGGHVNGEVVYVIRATYRLSLTPGMFVPSQGLAFVPWGGSDNPTSDFQVLCGFNLVWKSASHNTIPVDAFVAGYSEDMREALYIGRARHQGNLIPGKVQISHKVCYVPYEGKEVAEKEFEVLTVPGLNAHCANKYILYPYSFQ